VVKKQVKKGDQVKSKLDGDTGTAERVYNTGGEDQTAFVRWKSDPTRRTRIDNDDIVDE
jgi:hypothetical protein